MEGTIVFFGIIIWFLGSCIYHASKDAYKSSKTGSYNQAWTKKQRQKKTLERMAIENRYPLGSRYDTNSACYKAIQAHEERWAEPGTKTYDEIKKKEAAWDRGERW